MHFLLLCLLLVAGVFSQETPERKQFTLNTAIRTARDQNPIGKAANFDVEKASMNIKKAIIRKYMPIMDLKFNTGLVPAAEGDIFFSPDKQTDLDGLGPFFKLDLELTYEGVRGEGPGGSAFRRGDSNADNVVNIADAIFTLSYLFGAGEPPSCLDAADGNDDEGVDVADAIAVLSHLFGGGASLPEPFGSCGIDPTEGALDCSNFPPCP